MLGTITKFSKLTTSGAIRSEQGVSFDFDLAGVLTYDVAALAEGKFAAQAEQLRLYRSIATMDATAPLPSLPDQTPTWRVAAALAREWDLNRLADRLAEFTQSASGRANT